MKLSKSGYSDYTKLINIAKENSIPDRCVICGSSNSATSGEDIPPRGVFPTKKGLQLIKVPACYKCNNGTSHIDHAFKSMLALENNFGEFGNREKTDESVLLYEKLLADIEGTGNQRLHGKLLRKLRKMVAKGPRMKKLDIWPTEYHDPVLQKIIAGLYWLFYKGQYFADKSFQIRIDRYFDFSQKLASKYIMQLHRSIDIGNGQFIARHAQNFDGDTDNSGIFILSLHFHCDYRPDVGYHVLVHVVPSSLINTNYERSEGFRSIFENNIETTTTLYTVNKGKWMKYTL